VGGSWPKVVPLPRQGEIFAIEVRAVGAAIVLVLRGELDLAGAPRLSGALEAAMAAGYKRIALELGQLEFIDGASIGLIERVRGQLRARGGELTLGHPRPQIRRVIDLCARLSGPGEDLDPGAAPIMRRPSAEVAAVGQ
jgi:anti-sigma B factor antagonist